MADTQELLTELESTTPQNKHMLEQVGVGVGEVDPGGLGTAPLVLPQGWTAYTGREWCGTMGHATVIKDAENDIVCEIVRNLNVGDNAVIL